MKKILGCILIGKVIFYGIRVGPLSLVLFFIIGTLLLFAESTNKK